MQSSPRPRPATSPNFSSVEEDTLQQAHAERLLSTMQPPLTGPNLRYARLVIGDHFGLPRGQWVSPTERNAPLIGRGMDVQSAHASREFSEVRATYERALSKFIEARGANRRLNPQQLEALRAVDARDIAIIAAKLKRRTLGYSLKLSDEQLLAKHPVVDPFDLPFFKETTTGTTRPPRQPKSAAPAPAPPAPTPEPAAPTPDLDPEPSAPTGEPVTADMVGTICKLNPHGSKAIPRMNGATFRVITRDDVKLAPNVARHFDQSLSTTPDPVILREMRGGRAAGVRIISAFHLQTASK